MADPARTAALEVLRAVRSADAYTNLALPAALRRHGLSGRDAAFATELASGTVRRQGLYDAVLAACVDRPLAKVQARVLDALRLGVHQLLAMRVPAHAAISTTVALVRSDVGPGAAGFANAVLRRVSEHDLGGWVGRVAPARESDLFGHLSVAHAHPRWVVEALAAAVGGDEIEALLAADNEPPGVTLVARPGRSTRDELPGEPTPYSPYGVRLAAGDPGAVAAVAEGRAGVQDEGSQLVALALASAPLDGPDRALARPLRRAGRQGRAARGAGRRARCAACSPASSSPTAPDWYDVRSAMPTVCSAWWRPTAYAHRGRQGRSTARWSTHPAPGSVRSGAGPRRAGAGSPSDLDALVPLQKALLSSALDSVRPGGVVLYATCSPVLAETSEVVSAVLAARADAALEDATALLPGALLVQGTRGSAARHVPALAAPARHRRRCSGRCCVGSPGDRGPDHRRPGARRHRRPGHEVRGGEPGTVSRPETVPGSPLGRRGPAAPGDTLTRTTGGWSKSTRVRCRGRGGRPPGWDRALFGEAAADVQRLRARSTRSSASCPVPWSGYPSTAPAPRLRMSSSAAVKIRRARP